MKTIYKLCTIVGDNKKLYYAGKHNISSINIWSIGSEDAILYQDGQVRQALDYFDKIGITHKQEIAGYTE
jgi:hypothetical protein